MDKKGILKLGLALWIVALLSLSIVPVGRVQAQVGYWKKTVLFQDNFDGDEVDWNKWASWDKPSYTITGNHELQCSVNVTKGWNWTQNIHTKHGFLNTTIVEQDYAKMLNTYCYGYKALLDQSNLNNTTLHYGILVGVLFDSWNNTIHVISVDKWNKYNIWNATFNLTLNRWYLVQKYYNRTGNNATVTITDVVTGEKYIKQVTNIRKPTGDVKDGFYTFVWDRAMKESNRPNAYYPVMLVDSVLIYTWDWVSAPPTPPVPPAPAVDRSKDIGMSVGFVAIVILLGGAIFYPELVARGWLAPVVIGGLILLGLGAGNYYYGWLKTIPPYVT